ncbi:penicillin-binding protein activator LpoB [Moellerella wisconsensis]|uniref:Penicillin-binding protein activator LpoB n=1 Tax=Moellerella wisconsensis ATCC 35017 TaxID=1354267 RepID=A0A0N0Z7Z3_9GAMM|nr:penicillin-binding protein activator LpoB [Moellerella wisconsensis]KPD02579.1 hypothetical protein M992_1733 [Moellerella wisconsensis ATCC 35017]VFS48189.1 Lipoprotein activator of PBP from the outer membrane B [Moellerella wisconsensis]
MKRILLVMAASVLLAGCPSTYMPENKAPVETVTPPPEVEPVTPPPVDVVPIPPKQTAVDWSAVVAPLITQMASADSVESGKILLVDSVKNNTNGALPVAKVTSAIVNTVDNTGRFNLVPQDVVVSARKALGLSQEDSLVTRSKAIGLGRYVQANYVLYSVVSGSKDNRDIEMQLLSVQSGEILWSGDGKIDQ